MTDCAAAVKLDFHVNVDKCAHITQRDLSLLTDIFKSVIHLDTGNIHFLKAHRLLVGNHTKLYPTIVKLCHLRLTSSQLSTSRMRLT